MVKPWKLLSAAAFAVLLVLAAGESNRLTACVRSVIANGDFDKDLTWWSAPTGFGFVKWLNEDVNGSNNSGMLQMGNQSPALGQNLSISQCGTIVGGTAYTVSAKIHPDNFCCVAGQGASPEATKATRHTGLFYVLLNFYPRASCSGTPLDSFVRLDAAGTNQWQNLSQTFNAPATALSVRTTVAVFKNEIGDTLSAKFDDIFLFPSGAAAADPTALCLGKGRFRTTATWTTPDGQSGIGQPVQLTSDTGYFWFFDKSNVEMIVKVLNGCGINSEFWAFAGGLTDVNVTLKITDIVNGTTQTYSNPQGTAFLPIQDTAAFATCTAVTGGDGSLVSIPDTGPGPPLDPDNPGVPTRDFVRTASSSEAVGCTPDATTLCLNKGRFAVTTQWTKPDGQSSFGVPVVLSGDTGYFFFFDRNNVEMVVKVLNGCGVTGAYWVFAGGLTNVNVVMTVVDTQTGITKTYTNPQGTPFLPIQDTLAFATCP